MWAFLAFLGIVAASQERGMSVNYPVKSDALPKVGAQQRVLIGQDFSVPFYSPKDNQETFILFMAYDNIDVSFGRK